VILLGIQEQIHRWFGLVVGQTHEVAMRNVFWVRVCLLAVVVADWRPYETAMGCAPAPRYGEYVGIHQEDAFVVWDASSQTEHFIRRANFRTQAADFGFLVPTPSVPELGETSPDLFTRLAKTTAPRHEYKTTERTEFGYRPQQKVKGEYPSAAAPQAGSVELIQQTQVAGYDASVLRADDAEALLTWLKDHDYEVRPALSDWLKIYTDEKWIITAFKVSRGRKANGPLGLGAVRMTFKTEKPFYPYREPIDAPAPKHGSAERVLRVYLLADQRYRGVLGETGRWRAATEWADRVPDSERNGLATAAGVDPASLLKLGGQTPWLTEFADYSSPRKGTDEVFFSPSPDTGPLERPPVLHHNEIVHYWPGDRPGDLAWIGLAAGLLVAVPVYAWRRRSGGSRA
jgi:hypothetical protein